MYLTTLFQPHEIIYSCAHLPVCPSVPAAQVPTGQQASRSECANASSRRDLLYVEIRGKGKETHTHKMPLTEGLDTRLRGFFKILLGQVWSSEDSNNGR